MKRFDIYSLMAALSLLILGACTPKHESLFDESASERTANAMAALQEKLLSSPNGWIAEYYPGEPSGEKQYGGYVMSIIFTKDGEAFISSERTRSSDHKYSRGQYVVSSDAGVSLNFVTYNEALHFFADPDYRVGAGGGFGYEGDFEFLLKEETNPDEIILKGKNKGQILKLIRPKTSSEDYLEACMKSYDKVFDWNLIEEQVKDSYAGKVGGKDMVLFFDKNNTFYYINDEDNEVIVPFIPTDKGIKFQSPLNGVTELTYDASTATLNAENTSLSLREDPNYKYYAEYLGEYIVKDSKHEYNVTFEKAGSTKYKVTCPDWNYYFYANFDAKNRRFAVYVQEIESKPGTKLAMWDTTEGYLTWGNEEIGMYSKQIETADGSIVYKLVDNKVWGSYKADSFYLRDVKGKKLDKTLKPNKIIRPIFIKK